MTTTTRCFQNHKNTSHACSVGPRDGADVGVEEVGIMLGGDEGVKVGEIVGAVMDGLSVGWLDGIIVGAIEGGIDGLRLGAMVGYTEGPMDGAFDAVNRISANCGGVSPKIGSLNASLISENRRSFSLDESSVTSKPNSCANARITVPERGRLLFSIWFR